MIRHDTYLTATLQELMLLIEEHYMLGQTEAEIAIGAMLDSPSAPPMFDEDELTMRSGVLQELFAEKVETLNRERAGDGAPLLSEQLTAAWREQIHERDLKPLLKQIQSLWMKAEQVRKRSSSPSGASGATTPSATSSPPVGSTPSAASGASSPPVGSTPSPSGTPPPTITPLPEVILDEKSVAVLSQHWYCEGILDGLQQDGRRKNRNAFDDRDPHHPLDAHDDGGEPSEEDISTRLRLLSESFHYLHLYESAHHRLSARPIGFQDINNRYEFLWSGTRVELIQVQGLETDWGLFGMEGGQ